MSLNIGLPFICNYLYTFIPWPIMIAYDFPRKKIYKSYSSMKESNGALFLMSSSPPYPKIRTTISTNKITRKGDKNKLCSTKIHAGGNKTTRGIYVDAECSQVFVCILHPPPGPLLIKQYQHNYWHKNTFSSKSMEIVKNKKSGNVKKGL